MSDQETEELEQKVAKKGPGEQLQTARIEQSISIEDIARQMNLNAKILESIEEDDYSDIQSPIFVRGYLRTYARLVGLDEDKMIELFAGVYQQDEQVLKSIGNTTPEISSNDIRVKWMTYAVVLGLIALISIWWVNNYRSNADTDIDTASQSTESAMSENAVTENIEAPEIKMPLVETIEPSIENTESAVISSSNLVVPDQHDTIGDDKENINQEINAIDSEQVVEVVVQAETNVSSNDVMIQQDSSDIKKTEIVSYLDKKEFTKEVSSPSGSDVLEINVIATSWGNIKDANKFSLVQDLLNAGSTYRLTGKAPFNVFLGNGYGVEIKLNGQDFDFSTHIKASNNTARFELEK